jgi:aminopeptidase N
MRKTTVLVLLMISALLHGQVTFNENDLMTIVKGERDSHAVKISPGAAETTSDYDVKWYRCFWDIDPSISKISGNVTTLFTPLQQDFDSLVLDLNQALTVDSVIYHHYPLSWYHSSDLLIIQFSISLSPQVADSVTVYYHGFPPENGLGSFERNTHNGIPILWTLSEPYGASDWWPCKNGLSDKADSIDIFIRTLLVYNSASNGILVKAIPDGYHTVYHWKHRYPIPAYLVCLAVTDYAIYNQKVPFDTDTLEVINFVFPDDSITAIAQTRVIVPLIQLFDTLFGIYPFQQEKYGHAQWTVKGGMEHQTMTFVNSFDFELLAHELAHQWFGDMVTCGSWTDIWLNEGFATYLSGLCYEHLAPEFWIRFREVRVKKIISDPAGSVFCPDTTNIYRIFDGRLSYAKGAMILHQLRWIFGDSTFFAALNNYLYDATLSYGFARTENLKSHFESSCGQDLTWYFNDWFTGEGFPSYQVRWSQTGDTVLFTLSQTQSHPSVSFFELPVQLKFKNATCDTLIRFSNTFSGQSFTVILPFTVDSVIFDPDYQIISGNNTINAIAEHSRQPKLQIFPNPATDRVTFRFGLSPQGANGRISIYDYSGRFVQEHLLTPGASEFTLNTTDYIPGLYFYFLMQKDYRESGKFIICPGQISDF